MTHTADSTTCTRNLKRIPDCPQELFSFWSVEVNDYVYVNVRTGKTQRHAPAGSVVTDAHTDFDEAIHGKILGTFEDTVVSTSDKDSIKFTVETCGARRVLAARWSYGNNPRPVRYNSDKQVYEILSKMNGRVAFESVTDITEKECTITCQGVSGRTLASSFKRIPDKHPIGSVVRAHFQGNSALGQVVDYKLHFANNKPDWLVKFDDPIMPITAWRYDTDLTPVPVVFFKKLKHISHTK